MNKVKIVLTILFIVLYFWASKIIDLLPSEQDNQSGWRQKMIGTKKYSKTDMLTHTEATTNWILESSVCTLGKVVFFLWTFVLLFNLFMPINKKLLYFLAFLTILITGILNMPLFVRALPAFVLLLVIIFLDN
jgi:hypothetical protein